MKEPKLYIVTYYTEENERDWSIVVAESYEDAIDTAIRELIDLLDMEELGFTEFEAYEQPFVGKYKVVLEAK